MAPSRARDRRWRRGSWLALAGAVALVGCGGHTAAVGPTTTIATTTTTAPPTSDLTVVGVRPGVLQAPFYPSVTVGQVTCGVAPKGGVFVRIDLPAGGPGTTPGTVLTKPTAVIVVPGTAVVIDPTDSSRVLYAENMSSLTTTNGPGADFVLTMANFTSRGGNGLSVVVGNVQVNGGYQCPPTAVPYPGT